MAYGVVVPTPNRFVVDASRKYPEESEVETNVKLTSVPPPPPATAAHVRFPEPSVFKKFPLTIVVGQVYVFALNCVVPVAMILATFKLPERNAPP